MWGKPVNQIKLINAITKAGNIRKSVAKSMVTQMVKDAKTTVMDVLNKAGTAQARSKTLPDKKKAKKADLQKRLEKLKASVADLKR